MKKRSFLQIAYFSLVVLTLCLLIAMPALAQAPLASAFTFVIPDQKDEEPGETSEISPESATQTGAEAAPRQSADPDWTYPIPRELLEDPLDVIRLVNVNNLLDSDYPPKDDDLYTMLDAKVKKTKNDEMLVREVAHDALVRMFDDAATAGLSLRLHSAYRSHYRQAVMHENRVKSIGKDDGVVQKPGASDHQTGLGFDVINPAWAKESRLNSKFAETAEAMWMAAHCAEYGFIIRYPDGKTDITGIIYEPWHLRYVGQEVAKYITESGLTLEEFTAEWRHALASHELGESVPDEDEGVVVDSFSF